MTAVLPPRHAQADADADTAPDFYSYDAFISYSGFRKTGEESDFDRKVAERLHRSLEAYRVPRALLKRDDGRAPVPRRLKKIFRDRDEVRASGSLYGSLTEALRRSRFLIVVCSPRARQSQWMNQEVAIFHDLGRSERILPLLIEGEPADSFPEELFRARAGTPGTWLAQPLAADIRAPSVSKSLRLLKQEKLRLLAPILGCEYDDLRRREQERFVRRVTGAGAALLTLLLVVSTLSVLFYLARQRENRNKELAISAAAAILPLTGLDPNSPLGANDPVTREVFISNAIGNLAPIHQDDPLNLKCLTTLRALYGARSELLRARNRPVEAEEAYRHAVALVIPIALSRLRSWKPTPPRQVRDLSGEQLTFPHNYDLDRLRNLLIIMEQLEGTANIKQAVEYVEVAAEYVLLLDTTTAEGRAEARRVLQTSLDRFRQAQTLAALTPEQQELVEAIEATLGRVPPD